MADLTVQSRREFGQLRANPSAVPGGNFMLPACDNCGTDEGPCEDIISVTAAGSVAAVKVVINGVDYAFPAGTTLDDTTVIENTIADGLKAQGEFNLYVSAVYAGGVLTVTHVGRLALSSFTHTVSTTVAADRDCEMVPMCDYSLSVVDDPGDLIYDGSDPETLANAPYEFTGTPATDDATAATLATDINDALTAAGVPTGSWETIEVTVDSIEGVFVIKTKATFDFGKVTLGGKSFLQTNCTEDFQ